ncbi:hypothetical protein C2845_PM02G43100 [Panicum miliaceum]|uniref:Uncharacterized protein n=1 Tax=Panicum miliaceum TaxID=4540 RepID=A0A3L6SIW7_PANMI|nr:hypothetical protein C2845_PM02G43100 [Panicum miliaceum]
MGFTALLTAASVGRQTCLVFLGNAHWDREIRLGINLILCLDTGLRKWRSFWIGIEAFLIPAFETHRDLAKGAKAKGPGDQFEVHEEHSSANVTEATNQTENSADSHSQRQCHGNNPSTGSKCTSGRKWLFVENDATALDFSSVAKSLKTLADAETANTALLNAMHTAFSTELEAQRQTAQRRDQLFNELKKFTEFSHDQVVKAAFIIGQDEAKLNLFFTTPYEYKSEFIRQESQRHRITSNYLLQWQEMLKEAAADGDEILFTFNWRSLDEASKTNNNQIGTSGPLAYTKIAIYNEDVEKLNSTVDKLEKLSADTEEFIKLVELEVLREEENLHTKGKNTVTCNSLALNSLQDEHQPFNEAI